MKNAKQSKSTNLVTANSRSDMKDKIISYVRAGYPGLYLVSHEEQRVIAELIQISKELEYALSVWSAVDGLVEIKTGKSIDANDPLAALIEIEKLEERTVIVLQDFHLFLSDPNPVLLRKLKDVLQVGKTKHKTLIILGCRLCLPPELERELTVIEFSLPGKEDLNVVLTGIMESAEL